MIEANRGCPLSSTSVTVGVNKAFATGSSANQQLGTLAGPTGSGGCRPLVSTQVAAGVNLGLGSGPRPGSRSTFRVSAARWTASASPAGSTWASAPGRWPTSVFRICSTADLFRGNSCSECSTREAAFRSRRAWQIFVNRCLVLNRPRANLPADRWRSQRQAWHCPRPDCTPIIDCRR